MRNEILAFMLFLLPMAAMGQGRITGKVFEYWYSGDVNKPYVERPVGGAAVTVVSGKDTLKTVTTANGLFDCKRVGVGMVKIVCGGGEYEISEQNVELFTGENIIFVELKRKITTLAEARVRADAPVVTHHKDTLIFNASAVRTMEGDNALEILRQMPGVEIKRGKIRIHGKEVKRTYVNGTLVYGDQVMAPLNAVLADAVVNIKSYEETSVTDRRRKARHGKKETVLDITTKEQIVRAVDAHASAGLGIGKGGDFKYSAGAVGNFFSEKFLAYGNIYANNIGLTDNSFKTAGHMSGDLRTDDNKVFAQAGVQKYWGDRMMGSNIKAEYNFTYDNSKDVSRIVKDYYENMEGERRYEQNCESGAVLGTHSASIRADINNEKIKSLNIGQNVSFSNRKESDMERSLLYEKDALTLTGLETREVADRQWQVGGDITWSDNQNPKGWFPSLTFGYDIGNNRGNGMRADTLASSLNRRFLVMDDIGKNSSLSFGANCNVFLLNNEKATVMGIFGLGANRSRRSSKRMAIDRLDPDNSHADYVNTFDYNWNVSQYGAIAAVQASFGMMSVEMDANFKLNRLNGVESIPETKDNSRLYLTPGGSIKVSRGMTSFRYSVDSSLPSQEQARERVDNTNPLFPKAGNPDLRPEYIHTLTLGHAFPKVGKSGSITLVFDSELKTASHVYKTVFFQAPASWHGYEMPAGATLTIWENAGLSTHLSLDASYKVRFQKIKTTVTFGARYGYSALPEYIADDRIVRRESAPEARAAFDCRPDKKTRLSLNASVRYMDSRSSRSDLAAVNARVSVDAARVIGKYFFVRGSYNWGGYIFTKGSSDAVHVNGLNAIAGVRLLKGMLVISVSGNDLLNQASGYTVKDGANYRVQRWQPSLGRYFMLNISYRFNRTKPGVEFAGGLVSGQ